MEVPRLEGAGRLVLMCTSSCFVVFVVRFSAALLQVVDVE